MIFLSHNHQDKPVVEPVALALRDIFGEEKVFYDSWSIQPGDGIIQKMNEGLNSPDFVFFFVSENSLKSKMVELEWQNSLLKATKGECRLIPVRVDDAQMPAILLQNLYIDMFKDGLEVTVANIVSLVQGNKGFAPAHQNFSNLTWTTEGNLDSEIEIVVSASHLMEPNPSFLVLTENQKSEIKWTLSNNAPFRGGFTASLNISGNNVNAIAIAPLGGAITPKHPLRIKLQALGEKPIILRGVMHQTTYETYSIIPPKAAF